MSSGHAQLDSHRLHHVHQQSLGSALHLYHDARDLHPQPPPASAQMDVSGFDDFPFTYQGLSDRNQRLTLASQPNVTHPVDSFPHQPSMAAVDVSHTMNHISGHGSGFGPPSSGHQPSSMNGSDGSVSERNSPLTTSLDDSVADEFGLPSHGPADGTDLGGRAKEDQVDATPAWSELKTKAGKERKRLPLACIACRRKKIRCSGEKPACKHCLRGRFPCVYKVNSRKAAPRTDYMAMLDKRLKRMEDRIIKVIPRPEQEAATSSITRAVVKPSIPGTAAANRIAQKKRSADEAFGPGLAAWAKNPSRSKIASDERPNLLLIQEAEETKLHQEGSEALPTQEVQELLAEVFFDHIYGQAYHLLHKPSYMRKLKNNSLPPVLVLSVCAVAARFSADTKLKSESPNFLRGEEWASKARDICTARYEWPNITILTCLLLLGLHEFGTCQGGRSWALGGQAIRMAFALQLHKDLDYDPTRQNGKKVQLSFVDREIRRRIMWACFLMDRFNSSGTDRPMFIREDTITIPLPVKEHFFQLDMPAPTETLHGQTLLSDPSGGGHAAEARENMGVAAYMIRSIALWGRIITYLYQGGKERDSEPLWSDASEFARLTKDAETLESTLPAALVYSSASMDVHRSENTASQFIFLHMTIQQCILFMNRAAMAASNGPADQQAPNNFLPQASAKMVASANRISEFLREAEGGGYVVSAPFAGYCAFCSTTVHILGIVSRNETVKRTAGLNLATNLKFLQKMKKYWGMFFYIVENVRTQYRNALDAARTGNVVDENLADLSILQYGDWFNRYPHGLSDAEFMDPASHIKKEKEADGVLEAKTDLKSVGDFISSSLSPPSTGGKEGQRATNANAKRKSMMKKQGPPASRQGLMHQMEQHQPANVGVRATPDQTRPPLQQQRSFSLGGQGGGPSNFSPLTIVPQTQTQNSPFNTMSPISPATVNPFPHHANSTSFFPPDMVPMTVAQQASGLLQPLDRQLVFGSYSLDASPIGNGQNMMDGVDWNNLTGASQANSNVQGNETGIKAGMNGQQQHHQAQVLSPATAMPGFNGHEASSQWFMPFNMDPPGMGQDLGVGFGSIDAFGGTYSANGSGMTTPNPLGGLRHGQ